MMAAAPHCPYCQSRRLYQQYTLDPAVEVWCCDDCNAQWVEPVTIETLTSFNRQTHTTEEP